MRKYNLKNLCAAEEVKSGLVKIDEVKTALLHDEGLSFIDNGEKSLLLGQTKNISALVKICTNIGTSSVDGVATELHKIEILNKLPYKAHILFDHTRNLDVKKPFWKFMVENYDGIVATAPVIVSYDQEKGLDKNKLLDSIEEMASYGVKLMLFHPTATRDLWDIASNNRIRPTTSWNGALIYRDLKMHNRSEALITEMFDDILKILYKYNVTCDIGTAFRPARISEALDEVHVKEIKSQEQYIDRARDAGVFVIREGVGHIPLNKIDAFCNLLNEKRTPLMPLPVSTDAAIGFDHIACAVATTMIGTLTDLGIINPVTRVEHTGGVPNIDVIVEALKTARIVAHSINLKNIHNYADIYDNIVSDARQQNRRCVVSGGLFQEVENEDGAGCSRCDLHCPFLASVKKD